MPESSPIPIIGSKLYQPQNARDLIGRERLLAAYPAGLEGAVTLVSAPAGYGKSTFVSQSIKASGRPCAWLSLDPGDSDLRQFLAYVVAAIATAYPSACHNAREALLGAGVPVAGELAGILSNDIDEIEEQFCLVLDDYYQITGSPVHEFVDTLLRRPPRRLHMFIVTRRDPPLLLQTLRAGGALREVRMKQLAFTEAEARALVLQDLGNSVSKGAIARLYRLTEGWPVAVRLAIIAMSELRAADEFIDRIPDDVHQVREYLMHEVLAKQTAGMRRFLLRTAFLDRFCAPLGEALLPHNDPGAAATPGQPSGREFMQCLRETGLFSIPLDGKQEWFRYHHLFQTMLQDQARAELGDAEIRDLLIRASRWLERRGLLEEAIQNLLRADGAAEAALLMIRHRHAIMNNEQWHRLAVWLRLLPSGMIDARPELLLLKARLLRTAGSREEAHQVLDKAESLLATVEVEPELRQELAGSLESARCYQLFAMSDGAGAVAAARRALEQLPLNSLAERGFAMIVLGASLQMTGDVRGARQTLYAAMSEAMDADGGSVTYSSRLLLALCFVHWMDADLNALAAVAEKTTALALTADLREALAVSLSFKAANHYHRNELAAANACLQELLRSKAIASVEFHAQCLIVSSLAHQELGDATSASRLAGELRELALQTRNVFIIALSDAFSAEIAQRQGHLAEALNWASDYDPEPFTPLYSFYSPTLTLVKVLVLDDRGACRERAGMLLDKLIDYLTGSHNNRFLIEALALRAMLRDACADRQAAADDLAMAISLAQPGRFIRLFADLGPRLGSLLNRLTLEDESLAYVGEILAALRQTGADPAAEPASRARPLGGSQAIIEPLSRREQEILALLADRLSNKEIAGNLHISVVTVKRHAANIYQKLGVHGRRQAVAKATGLGMLDQST